MKLLDPRGVLGLGKGGQYMVGTFAVLTGVVSGTYAISTGVIYHRYALYLSGQIIGWGVKEVSTGGRTLGDIPKNYQQAKDFYREYFTK